jgi:hypothetical protein
MWENSPPRPELALRVGVIGHRPRRLPATPTGQQALGAAIEEILDLIAATVAAFAASPAARIYAADPPQLRLVSPLAEGADRFVVKAALDRGWRLSAAMPFAREEFEKDFHPPEAVAEDALDDFQEILSRAAREHDLRVFELDGRADERPDAYVRAGEVVLGQSDVLIVIWDGGTDRSLGGTYDTLVAARDVELPTVWIDPAAPERWVVAPGPRALTGAHPHGLLGGDPRATLQQFVTAELSLGEDEQKSLTAFQAETYSPYNLAFLWRLTRDLLDRGRLRMPALKVRPYLEQIAPEWPVAAPGAVEGSAAAADAEINARLRAHFAWADKLADRYADAHRSGFIWTSMFAALAVFLALLPMALELAPLGRSTFIVAIIEFFVLAVLLGLPWQAQRRNWHQKWLDYRVAAELIRELSLMAPLGGGAAAPRTPAHLADYGDPKQSWMYWLYRALARAACLPRARVDQAYVDAQLERLDAFLGDAHGGSGQLGFHTAAAERHERIHERLHALSLGLFGITLAGVASNWILPLFTRVPPHWAGHWLVFISAFFPAFGAALASINNQGEFARLQRRSQAMAQGFSAIRVRIAALRAEDQPPQLADVAQIAERITAMMVEENSDWRVVVLDLPHAAG